MSAIFISHSSHDKAAAEEIMSWLEAEGQTSLFLDSDPSRGIAAGRNWERELYDRLRECRAVIVVCSIDSGRSRWCFAELTQARALQKDIFPIRIDDSPPDPLLADLQVIDARVGWPEAFERLSRGLEEAGIGGVPWDHKRPPYPGLFAFGERDTAVFFGREGEIRDGLESLRRLRYAGSPRLMVLIGPSGSGKSSLLRAGLLPQLRRDPESWIVVDAFRPGTRPVEKLADALVDTFAKVDDPRARQDIEALLRSAPGSGGLARVAGELREAAGRREATVLLPVDQLEELLGPGAGEAGGFLPLLCAALGDPESRLLVVATLRSDHLDTLQGSPALRDLAFENQIVRPVSPEGIAEVISGPAKVAGIRLEDGLVEAMVAETGTSDALPLLAFTLRELWEQHGIADRALSLEEYRTRLGGLEGSISRVAEAVMRAEVISAGDEEELHSALLAMVRLDDAGRLTRQPACWSDLPVRIHPVLERLVQARLLVSREENQERIVEVAHEALFRAWDRLRLWLEADTSFLSWRRGVAEARRAWEEGGRDPSGLLRGRRVSEAKRWLAERPGNLNGPDREFIAASVRTAAAEGRRRWAGRAGIAAAVLAVPLAGYLVGKTRNQERQARAARVLNVTGTVADPLVLALDPLVAALLLGELPADREPPGGAAVARRVADQPVPLAVLRAPGGRLRGAALSPDGSRAVTAYEDGAVRIWRVDGRGDPVLLEGHGAAVLRASFSRDGSRLVTASEDGTARVWPADGRGEPLVLHGHEAAVRVAVFSRDGTRVLSASDDGTARVWDATSGAPVRVLREPDGAVQAAAFSDDGARVVTGSDRGAVRVWPVGGTGVPLLLGRHGDGVLGVEISRDGSRVLSASLDGTARVWRIGGGGTPVVLGSREGAVWCASFSPDGSWVVTASGDGARIWPAAGSDDPVVLLGHTGAVRAASFSPDGSRVVTASADGTARLWWARDGRGTAVLRGHRGEVFLAAFAAAGSRLVTAATDEVARVWPAAGREDPVLLQGHRGQVWSVAFSPDGSRLVTAGEDGTTRVWRADGAGSPVVLPPHAGPVSGAELSPDGSRAVTVSGGVAWVRSADGRGGPLVLAGHRGAVSGAAFAPGGSRVVTSSDDGTARVWPLRGTREPVVLSGHRSWVRSAAFSPDGSRIVTASGDGTARVWSAAGGGAAVVLRGHTGPVVGAAFDAQGTRVVTASGDSTARVWSADGSGEPVVLRGHTGRVRWARFGPDGSRVVTASDDGTARVWSAGGGGEAVVLRGHEGAVRRAGFSRDGAYVVTASADGTVRVWRSDGGGEPVVLHADGPVQDARFSPDGSRVAAASDGGVVQVWRVGWRGLIEHLRGSTTACIPPEERARLLHERPDAALSAFERCERAHRRTPPSPSTQGESP